MTNANNFGSNYFTLIQNFVDTIEELRLLNARGAADNTLITNYFASAGARTDIVAQDVVNAYNALVAIIATYDGSNPSQKSYLFKML